MEMVDSATEKLNPLSTPENIDREIETGIVTEGIETYMNNFDLNFPLAQSEMPHSASYRHLYEFLGAIDKTFKELKQGDQNKKYSSVFLEQTPREFFMTLDAIAEEEGLKLDDIRAERDEIQKYGGSGAREKILTKLIPIYRNLRLKGYTSDDLTT